MVGAYILLAAIPVALWLGMELDARKHRVREIERRRRARKGYMSTWGR